MDKLTAVGMQNTQRQLLQDMQRMAALGGNPLAVGAQPRIIEDNAVSPPPAMTFSGALAGAINNVNDLQISASDKQTAVDMGISDDLSGTMLESQKASVAFSALVQVRNKLTTGLDEVMNTAL